MTWTLRAPSSRQFWSSSLGAPRTSVVDPSCLASSPVCSPLVGAPATSKTGWSLPQRAASAGGRSLAVAECGRLSESPALAWRRTSRPSCFRATRAVALSAAVPLRLPTVQAGRRGAERISTAQLAAPTSTSGAAAAGTYATWAGQHGRPYRERLRGPLREDESRTASADHSRCSGNDHQRHARAEGGMLWPIPIRIRSGCSICRHAPATA